MSQEKLELLRLEETALLMFEFLDQWSDYRIETEELEDLGEDSVLAAGRQRGTGKLSGAEADHPIFILFEFGVRFSSSARPRGSCSSSWPFPRPRIVPLLPDAALVVYRSHHGSRQRPGPPQPPGHVPQPNR